MRHSGTLGDQKINEYIFKNPFSALTRLSLFYPCSTRRPNQWCFAILRWPDAAVLPAGVDCAGCASRQNTVRSWSIRRSPACSDLGKHFVQGVITFFAFQTFLLGTEVHTVSDLCTVLEDFYQPWMLIILHLGFDFAYNIFIHLDYKVLT